VLGLPEAWVFVVQGLGFGLKVKSLLDEGIVGIQSLLQHRLSLQLH
jgi:hypothetical protein